MDIKQQLIADRSKTFGEGNGKIGVTIHETANQGQGAGAQAHANLQSKGNVRSATWQWSADDTMVIQSFDNDVRCWHAGDGRGDGNMNTVAIEICVNPDSDFVQAVHNAAELVHNLRADGVGNLLVQHNHWSGKDCPTWLRNGQHGITWDEFVALVNGGATPVSNPITPPPAQPVTPPAQRVNPYGRALLDEDGKLGPLTITEWQLQEGTPVDGVINGSAVLNGKWYNTVRSALITAVQARHGTPQDGVVSYGKSTLVGAMETRFGTPVDYYISWPVSSLVQALQKALNEGRYL
jgi:hypothetical protein